MSLWEHKRSRVNAAQEVAKKVPTREVRRRAGRFISREARTPRAIDMEKEATVMLGGTRT